MSVEKGRSARLFPWSPESVRWYQNASDYCGSHKKIAQLLLRELPADANICDVGCGVGSLSLALSPHCRSVAAVDVSPLATGVLRAEIAQRDIQNIDVICGDFNILPPPLRPYDAAVFCLYGSLPDCYYTALSWASGKLFFLVNTASKRKFSASGENRASGDETAFSEFLDAGRVSYALERFTLPFGQPFTDMKDALRFMEYYNPNLTDEALPDFLAEKLEPAQGGYGWYLPAQKELALFSVDCKGARQAVFPEKRILL